METIKRALGISGGTVPSPPTAADYPQLLAREQALQHARKGQPCTKTPLACTVSRCCELSWSTRCRQGRGNRLTSKGRQLLPPPPPPPASRHQLPRLRARLTSPLCRSLCCPPLGLAVQTESDVKLHPTKTMLALEWRGAEKVEVTPRIARAVTDPGDALIRVTSNTICGSDLHMYKNQVGEERDATVAI